MVDNPQSRPAYEQLVGLETEMRESGIVYTCPLGRHDDLGIFCAMLVWAARNSLMDARGLLRPPAAETAWQLWLGSFYISPGGYPSLPFSLVSL